MGWGFTSCRSRSRDSWKRKQKDLMLHHGYDVVIYFIYMSISCILHIYICIYIYIPFFVSFCLLRDIHKLCLRRNLNFLDPPQPTRPDHENRAKRRGERGRVKKKQKWLRALRRKTQDQNMIPPKGSGKDLFMACIILK